MLCFTQQPLKNCHRIHKCEGKQQYCTGKGTQLQKICTLSKFKQEKKKKNLNPFNKCTKIMQFKSTQLFFQQLLSMWRHDNKRSRLPWLP